MCYFPSYTQKAESEQKQKKRALKQASGNLAEDQGLI